MDWDKFYKYQLALKVGEILEYIINNKIDCLKYSQKDDLETYLDKLRDNLLKE